MKKIIISLGLVLIIIGGVFFLNANQGYLLFGKNETTEVATPVVTNTIIGTIILDQPKDFKKVEYVYESLDPIIAKIKEEVTNAEIITQRTAYLGGTDLIESQGRLVGYDGEYQLSQGTNFGEKTNTKSSAIPIIISTGTAQQKMVKVGDTFEEVLMQGQGETSGKDSGNKSELVQEFIVQGIFDAVEGAFYMPKSFISSEGFNQISEKTKEFTTQQGIENNGMDYSSTFFSFATESEYQIFIETYRPQLPQYYKFSKIGETNEPEWETMGNNKLSYQSSGIYFTDNTPIENGNARTCFEKGMTEMKLRNDSDETITLTTDNFYYEYGTERIALENELILSIEGVEKQYQSNLPKTLAPGEEVTIQILHQATIEGQTYGGDTSHEDIMSVDVSFFYTDGNEIVQLAGEAVTGAENRASCNAVLKE